MTPFSQIYKLTMSLLDKNERIQEMNLDLKMDLFSDLILITSSADFTNCVKDLSSVNPYVHQSIFKTFSIGVHSVDIDLPDELIEYDGIIVLVNNYEVADPIYNINLANNTITITVNNVVSDDYEIEDDGCVEVVFYKDGYFEERLNYREKTILAYGVLLKLIGQEVAKEDRIKENLSDKDYSITGRWQTLNSLMEMQSTFKAEFKEYLKSYTYSVATTYEDLM